jgi:hypothetical protein
MGWRMLLGLLSAAGVAWLGSLILGEYEFTGSLPFAAGAMFGLVIGEVVVAVGRTRTLPVALAAAALAGAGIAWAGWIDSTQGLEPVKGLVWVAAGLAAVVALGRVRGRPRR